MNHLAGPDPRLDVTAQEWQLAFDAAPRGIALVDLDGTIVHANTALCTLLGYPAEQLRGRTFLELTHPDDLAHDFDSFHRLLRGEVTRYAVDERYLRRGGEYVWVRRCIALTRNVETGEPIRYVCTFEDITERVAAAEATARAIARQRAIIAAQSAIAEVQLNTEAVRDEICARAMGLTRATGAVLELKDSEHLVARSAAGQLELLVGTRFTADGSLAVRSMTQGFGLLCDDTETDPRARADEARQLGVRSSIVVPMRVGDEVVGVLRVVAPWPHHFSQEDVRALEVLAAPFGAAMRNAEELENTAAQVATDSLTGLANRLGAMRVLRRALTRQRRLGGQTAVLFLDLDGFKAVNDLHGHAVGDAVLAAVAERIRHTVRRSDTAGRFGGDEFVVVADSFSTDDEVDALAERLVAAICVPYPIEGAAPMTVGVSVGVAIARSETSLAEMLHSADRAMYAAKHQGGCGHVRVLVA